MNTASDAIVSRHVLPFLDFKEWMRFAIASKQTRAMVDYGRDTCHRDARAYAAYERRDFSGFMIVPESEHDDEFWLGICDMPCPETSHYKWYTLKFTLKFTLPLFCPLLYVPNLGGNSMGESLEDILPGAIAKRKRLEE